MTPDGELLRSYAETGSEVSFGEIVARHVDFVYSAALRQVNGDAHLAQDVAQSVFTDLARKADALARRPSIAGWLFTSTHFAAAKAVRTEKRRLRREQEAFDMHELRQPSGDEFNWESLRPKLDQTMHLLREADQEIILMRYFENRQHAEIGRMLGLSEEAARKRVDRALEKLRHLLAGGGMGTAAALAAALSANAVQAAPAGLSITLASASLAGAAAAKTSAFTFVKIMTMTKVQAGALGALVVAVILVPLAMQQRTLAALQQRNAALSNRLNAFATLPSDNRLLSNKIAAASAPAPLPSGQFAELLRLRSEVGRQRGEILRLRNPSPIATEPGAAHAMLERAAKSYFPKDSWPRAGYATPEAALQSTMAMLASTHDLNSMLAMLPPEARKAAEEYFKNKSPRDIAKELESETELFAKTDGLRVVNKESVSDDEVRLTFMTFYNKGTNDSWGNMAFKRVNGEWKPLMHP